MTSTLKQLSSTRRRVAAGETDLTDEQVRHARSIWKAAGYELPAWAPAPPAVQQRRAGNRAAARVPGVGDMMAQVIGESWFANVIGKVRRGCKGKCDRLKRDLNEWGPAKCEQKRAEIIAHIHENAGLPDTFLTHGKVDGWITEAIRRHLEAAETARATVRKPAAGIPQPSPPCRPQVFVGESRRNLSCHIFPVRGRWKWIVDALKATGDLFNGRKVFAIMEANGNREGSLVMDPPDVVREYIGDFADHVLTRTNKPADGEYRSFPTLVEIHDDEPNDITFYCHSKGAKHPDAKLPAIQAWSDAMLECLTDRYAVEAAFNRGHSVVGALGCQVFKSEKLVPAGTFYWYRNDQAPHLQPYIFRKATSEQWPARFATDAAYLLGTVPVTPGRDYRQLYTLSYWKTGPGKQLLDAWRTRTRPRPDPLVTLITPTGDRPEAFALLEKWMLAQTWNGRRQWIVVDDGNIQTPTTCGQEYIRRKPNNSGRHTLGDNLAAALPHVRGDFVLIIEDDEYIWPEYVQLMVSQLQAAELVGERGARYYHLPSASWRHYTEHEHSSLARTGMRQSVLPLFESLLQDRERDISLWKKWTGSKSQWASDSIGSVGVRGMPGRAMTNGRPEMRDYTLAKLKQWCPNWTEYLPYLGEMMEVGAGTVYSVVLQGYDVPRPIQNAAPFAPVLVTDQETKVSGWTQFLVPAHSRERAKRDSREWKILSHTHFSDSEWVLYFDGQLQLQTSALEWFNNVRSHGDADLYVYKHQDRDCIYAEGKECIRIRKDKRGTIQPQLNRYRSEGVPEHGGLYLGGILIRRMCPAVKEFERIWWNEFCRGSCRDQISLPVAIQRSGVKVVTLPALSWTKHFQRFRHGTNTPVTERLRLAEFV